MEATRLCSKSPRLQRFCPCITIVRAALMLALFILYSTRFANAQLGSQPDTVLTDTEAYLVLPAELISGPIVSQVSGSPSGRNMAVLRTSMRLTPQHVPTAAVPNPPPPFQEHEIIFWNATIRKSVSLWQSAQPFTNVRFTDWMPTTESIYAIVNRTITPDGAAPTRPRAQEWKVLLLGLGIERAVPVAIPLGDYGLVNVTVSPKKPIGVLELIAAGDAQSEAMYLVHPNGRIGARIDVPANWRYSIGWDNEGNPTIENVSPRFQGARAIGVVDARNGHLLPMPKETPRPERPSALAAAVLPLRIVAKQHQIVESNTTQQTSPVWIESLTKSENPRALLTADGKDAAFVPGGTGIAFQSQNAVWFTPILKINKEAYLLARRAAERQVALSNAKQLGLAAIMYAQDNDEALPGPDGIEAKLMPYAQNGALFAGFTYTYGGGALADIGSPAETILGYVAGPGGRAVLYADGHAKWQND